jgi:LmbE family N-acetylglucosaminyl deacetylase
MHSKSRAWRPLWSAVTVLALLPGVALGQVTHGSYTGTNTGQNLVDLDFLFIGAHPDDEGGFTGTMGRYVLDEGFKGSVITYTLGEGGGNATGPELGTALGLIRFEELRRSLATVGVDRFYFLGLDDFYYTLFAEETHDNWFAQNPDYLCDAVRVVRLTRPEVIVTMNIGPGTHGHHQMAARAAVLAFNNAGDPDHCPEQITDEFLEPWQPVKLYTSPVAGRSTVEVPLTDFSRAAYMSYADLKALALMNYRSQGWDRFNVIPAPENRQGPERRLLVRSLVPINEPEEHMLEGTHLPTGRSPVGIQLEVEPDDYLVGVGGSLTTTVTFRNHTERPVEDLRLSAAGPEGWQVTAEGADGASSLEPGEELRAVFVVEIPDADDAIGQDSIWVSYEARQDGHDIGGQNYAWFEVVPPVTVDFEPMFDIANYREFARENRIEWMIPTLATRVPLVVGEANTVTIEVANAGGSAATGALEFDLPEGMRVEGDLRFDVGANETARLEVELVVDEAVLPEHRHSVAVDGSVSATVDGYTSTNQASFYALPTLTIPRVTTPPTIDGDLADMRGLASGSISHEDRWSGSIDGPEDVSGEFFVGYDDDYLYVGVRVIDDEVVCHMPPDEIRNHWHADSVELTIDPTGESENTSTTFKVGIFPCTTEGFEARASRDADANQGVIERTAPGMLVASQRLEDGYAIQTRIAWEDLPARPAPGDTIGFNVLIYDADDAAAGAANPGANLGKSRSGWASVLGAQQAIPYVWPSVTLGD